MKKLTAGVVPPILASALALAASSVHGEEAQSVGAAVEHDRIVVYVDGEEFTAYNFGEEHKYPFFYPVNGPVTGESVTTWDQDPYPHHSSLYISLDWVRSEGVERGNYWQPRHDLETGQVFSTAPRLVEATGNKVVLQDRCDWIVPGFDAHQMRDTRTITIRAPSAAIRVLDFEFKFEVLQDLDAGPTGHSFFSARLRPELAVGDSGRGPDIAHLGTGTIVDARGNRDETETFSKNAPWAAYYGEHFGETEGLAIVQHPENPGYPAPWFTRNYGFLSPTRFAFIEEPMPLPAGTKFTERYRVLVFAGDHQEAGIAEWAADFQASR